MADAKKTWSLSDAKNPDFNNYAKVVNVEGGRQDDKENKPFLYPGPFVRTIDGTSQKVSRGFMRSIIMGGEVASKLGVTGTQNFRLNFQFNPEYIERRVSQSPGAVNPLLQDPQNLTQAVPGTAQFNFTMTFNREQEVAQSNNQLNLALDLYRELSGFDSALADPGQVGVMHDLALFDKIIGQGITQDLVDIIQRYTEQQVIANNNQVTESNANNGEEEDAEITPFEATTFKSSVEKNFGNSAFLNPMPVRVVFSDLFMVEGLVVSSAVAFQKFNQNMIPTICQVNVELYALYVGFAKKKAFLTETLSSWASEQATTVSEEAQKIASAKIGMVLRPKKSYYLFNSSENWLPSADDYKLNVPDYNSVGMRVLLPSITNSFYAGNQSAAASRYVTVPQWFNTFASPNISYPSGTSVSSEILSGYTSGQTDNDLDSRFVGSLPVSVFIEYDSQGSDKLDATFNITFKLKSSSPNQTVTLEAKEGSEWTKVDLTQEAYSLGFTKVKDKNKVYRRLYWLQPPTVTQTSGTKYIDSNATCTLIIGLTMTQNINGVSAPVTVDFAESQITYSSTQAFFYKNNNGPTGSPNNKPKIITPTNKNYVPKRGGPQ